MVRKFLRKVSKNCRSFEKQTTQPEFSTGKSNGTEISGKQKCETLGIRWELVLFSEIPDSNPHWNCAELKPEFFIDGKCSKFSISEKSTRVD